MSPKPKNQKPKKKKSLAWRILSTLFFWSLMFTMIAVIALIVVAAFYEAKIGGLVVQELRKSLKTELKVERAELSLIWDFPKASVSLKNLALHDNSGDSSRYLLRAEDLSLKCSIWGLLSGHYQFNAISISNAAIDVRQYKDGQTNYDIFITEEEAEETGQSSDLNLSIKDANFKHVKLRYLDQMMDQDVSFLLESAFFAGDFNNERYILKSLANIQMNYLEMGGERYLENKTLGYNANIQIDHLTQSYSIKEMKLQAEGNEFLTTGEVVLVPKGTRLDLKFESDKAKLGALLQLLPPKLLPYLGGFESNAYMSFKAETKGLLAPNSLPMTKFNFGLRSGRLSHPNMSQSLKGVNFDVEFENRGGSSNQALLELKNFEGSLGGHPISLAIRVEDLDNPLIDFSFDGKLPIDLIKGFLGEEVSKGQGLLAIENVALKGRLNDMLNPRYIQKVNLGGALRFDNVGLVRYGVPLSIPEGSLALNNNVFSVNKLQFKSRKSDILLQGNFQNILPVLFADSSNSKQAELGFKASWASEKLDIDELMLAALGPQSQEPLPTDSIAADSVRAEKNEQRMFVSNFLFGSFKLHIQQLNYGEFEFKNIDGELAFQNNKMDLKGLSLEGFQGKMRLDARYTFDLAPKLLAFAELEKIDINQFFEQMDNFGQTTLEARHLRGRLSSLVKVNAFWDEQGHFMDNELSVLADASLEDGEIIGFEMLEDFSQYIKVKDLKHIRFNRVENQFRIANRKLYIPAMFIQSNAMNITLSGSHSFDQDMDYRFKINVGQILANRFKRYNKDMEPLPARKKGLFNVYARMYGNLYDEEYQYQMGRKKVKKLMEADMKEETLALSNSLKAEFMGSEFAAPGGSAPSGNNFQRKLNTLEEPDEWADIPEYKGGSSGTIEEEKEPEYIEW